MYNKGKKRQKGVRKMTRQEMIKQLEEIKEAIAWDIDCELTDYAREKAYIAIGSAIEFIAENEERELK